MKRFAFVCSAAILSIGATAFLRADYQAGNYNGGDLSADEESNINDAIACIDDKECAKGLKDMLDSGRICGEDWADSPDFGTTGTDQVEGSAGDVMNLRRGRIAGGGATLKCLLVHEWKHVDETGFESTAVAEKRAYTCHKKCLQGENVPAGDPELARVCERVDIYCKILGLGFPATRPPGLAPIYGYRDIYYSDAQSTFYIDQFFTDLKSYTDGGTSMNFFPLNLSLPYEMIDLGVKGRNGGRIVAISGMDFFFNGSVQYVEIDPATGTTIGNVSSVSLPGMEPLSIAYQTSRGTDTLFVLDVLGDAIHVLIDTNADSLPDFLLPTPYATSTNFAGLATAQSIISSYSDAPRAVHFTDTDMRLWRPLQYTQSIPELRDVNGDFVADLITPRELGDYAVVTPKFTVLPGFDDTSVELLGTRGATVQVWLSDAGGLQLQLLGSTVIGKDNRGTATLSSPLAAGQFLLLLDATYGNAHPPYPYPVGASKEYGTACITTTGFAPRAWFDGGTSIGTTSEWHLAGELPFVNSTLVLSFTRTAIDLTSVGAPGCTLYAWPAFLSVPLLTDADGNAEYLLPLPNDPGLIGLEVYGTWYVPDTINSLGLAFTNGVGLELQP